jgi:site-specific recombinase XerD
VNALLPALATYMGHVDIASTQVYLNAAGELLGPVNERFHNHFQQHIARRTSS